MDAIPPLPNPEYSLPQFWPSFIRTLPQECTLVAQDKPIASAGCCCGQRGAGRSICHICRLLTLGCLCPAGAPVPGAWRPFRGGPGLLAAYTGNAGSRAHGQYAAASGSAFWDSCARPPCSAAESFAGVCWAGRVSAQNHHRLWIARAQYVFICSCCSTMYTPLWSGGAKPHSGTVVQENATHPSHACSAGIRPQGKAVIEHPVQHWGPRCSSAQGRLACPRLAAV